MGLGVLALAWLGFGLATQIGESGTADTSLTIAFLAVLFALIVLAIWLRRQPK